MTSPFLESSWKIKLGSKGQAVSSVSGFWVIVNNLGEGPNYSSNSEDCLLLLIIIIIIFLRIFSRAYFSYNLAFIATKIHRNVGTIATWVAMTFCDVGYDRIWVISKKQDFTKKHNTPSIFTLLQIFFFYFVHVSKAKPMVEIRHDLSITVFKLEAIENDDFRENVKYLIS